MTEDKNMTGNLKLAAELVSFSRTNNPLADTALRASQTLAKEPKNAGPTTQMRQLSDDEDEVIHPTSFSWIEPGGRKPTAGTKGSQVKKTHTSARKREANGSSIELDGLVADLPSKVEMGPQQLNPEILASMNLSGDLGEGLDLEEL